MNFKKLKQKIENATKEAFIEIYNAHKDEEIYAFALYSDDGAMTVCPATNTVDFLNNLDDDEKEELMYYKFETVEWKYEGVGADEKFNDICSELSSELSKNTYGTEKGFLNFKNSLFEICIETLEKLHKENFFKDIIGKDIFLIFTVSDSGFNETEGVKIVRKLNNEDFTLEYMKWAKTW